MSENFRVGILEQMITRDATEFQSIEFLIFHQDKAFLKLNLLFHAINLLSLGIDSHLL